MRSVEQGTEPTNAHLGPCDEQIQGWTLSSPIVYPPRDLEREHLTLSGDLPKGN